MSTDRLHYLYLFLAYFAIYVVWGTTYLANLYALEGFKPFLLSGFRFIIAGTLLFVWCLLRKIKLPNRADIKTLSISGILMLIGGSGLVVYAEQYINSGYAAVLVATEPLLFVILDRSRWKQYFSNHKVILGLIVGFVGIALFIFYSPQDSSQVLEPDQLKGTIIVLLSAALWVIGTLYGKKNLSAGSFTVFSTTIQLFAAGIFAFLIASLAGEWNGFSMAKIPFNAWAGLLYLIVFGSLIAYLAFNWLVTVQSPALVSTHTYVNPVVAILIGWMINNEMIVGMQLVALAIVLLGILLSQRKGNTRV
ncbi:MAG: EamA family transporter [Sphingobacterium sp.]